MIDAIVAFVLAVVAIVGVFLYGDRKGRSNVKSKLKEADNERADKIRERVLSASDPDRLHEYDDAGWRD